MELVADTKPHPAFQDHERLIVPVMDVCRRTHQSCRHPALDDREPSLCVAVADLDQHRPTRQVDPMSVLTTPDEPADGLLLRARMTNRLERHTQQNMAQGSLRVAPRLQQA